MVRLNHAVAVALGHDLDAGLSLIDVLVKEGDLDNFHLLHASRAELLRRKGRSVEDAQAAFVRVWLDSRGVLLRANTRIM